MAVVSEHAVRTSRLCLGILKRAILRCWGRDVMLYVGGVSFFALLALFPALTLLIGFYSAVFTPEQAELQTQAFAQLLPEGAQGLVEHELHHLSTTPARTISVQSALALIIGAYAAHRGFKALLAGLTFIHDEEEPWGFLRFNFVAFVVALGSFVMATSLSGLIIASRIVKTEAHMRTGQEFSWFTSEWLWITLFGVVGLSGLYRWAMSHSGTVIWRAAVIGGIVATALAVCASAASAFYVNEIMHLGATYGSIATVIVFLIWVSWNVNAVFFGGALATEVEIVLNAYRAEKDAATAPAEPQPSLSPPERAFRR
ncbi:MAG TPA: YihY/virulence factor BrkB family protein [Caulobacteraceae bacterium]|nr:YihY/virulence factor BrkB family protein [Caulobacteraceae bacterium]